MSRRERTIKPRLRHPYSGEAPSWLSRFFRPEAPIYVVGIATAILILVMVAVILWSTFIEGVPSVHALFHSLGFSNYVEVFTTPILGEAAINTVLLAVGTTLVALFFATIIAWLVHRTSVPFKRVFVTLMLIHCLLPGFVRIIGWIMMLSPKIGVVNQIIRSIIGGESGPLSPYNLPFMMFLQGISLTPVLFLMLGGAFMAIDPSFEEAAEANGMSKRSVFWHVSLPLLKPSIFAGAIFVFVTALSMFEVPALLGSPYNTWVFSTLMYEAVKPPVGMPQFGIAGVYGIIALIPTLVALYYYQRMIKLSHRYRTVTGKGYRPKFADIGRWKWVGLVFILFYFFVDLVLPYLAVLWTSIAPSLQVPSWEGIKGASLDGYREGISVISNSGAIGNTIQFLIFTGLFSTVIGLAMSWITLRTKMWGRYALDTVAMLPQVVPGIAVAFSAAFLGIMLLEYTSWLYGSLAALIIVETVRRLPFSTRAISSSLIQIHPELEEAVLTSGGSQSLALRKVIVPLIMPALLYSFIWGLLQAYREVTTPLFLLSPRNQVLSTLIWTQFTASSNYDCAAAISIMMVGVMGVFILVLLYAFPAIRKAMQLD